MKPIPLAQVLYLVLLLSSFGFRASSFAAEATDPTKLSVTEINKVQPPQIFQPRNWCTTGTAKEPSGSWRKGTILSSSSDGVRWKNDLLPADPKAFVREVFGTAEFSPFAFPCNHGLLTRRGVMLFPNGFAGEAGEFDSRSLHAALRSDDGGKTWHWGKPSPPLVARSIVPDPANYTGDPHAKVWEPTYFEHPDGRIGVLLRHVSETLVDQPRPENRMLYAESGDAGLSWSVPRPVEVDIRMANFTTAN